MDKIIEGKKRIPVTICGQDCFIEPMTTRHLLEMQDYVLGKKSKVIRIVFEDEREIMIEELRKLSKENISIGNILTSDFDTLTYFLWVRCSIRDKVSYEDSLGDLQELQENIELLFGGEEKNVQVEQGK